MKTISKLLLAGAVLLGVPAHAANDRGFSAEVIVRGAPLAEIHGRGAVYVEALKERPYAIRITNPLPVRVAVALSVDGRNTIDARRTSASGATKWVLGPYESAVISGWQVNGDTARQFTFTTETRSYAAFLGDTANLGVIEAVFYRERQPEAITCGSCDQQPPPPPAASVQGGAEGSTAPRNQSKAAPAPAPSREMAATGMGDAVSHPVDRIDIDLESRPAARVRIRYEYHEQLVTLGLLPRENIGRLDRREQASGFSWCPEQ